MDKRKRIPKSSSSENMHRPLILLSKKPKKVHPSDSVVVPELIVAKGEILRLESRVGKGTFSKCYRVRSETSGRLYALKVQRLKDTSGDSVRRIQRELQIHKLVSLHPCIACIYDFHTDSKNVYLQLELCKGGDLLTYTRKYGAIKYEQAKSMMRAVSSAVAYIHSKRILHRDIKMANIFLNENLEPRLGDFGLACEMPVGETRRLSRAGTPAYMAPELALEPFIGSYASDVWALGVLWYAMLYGRLPFQADSHDETIRLISKGHYRLYEHPKPGSHFKGLIPKLLCGDATRRPSAAQLAIELSRSMQPRPHNSAGSLSGGGSAVKPLTSLNIVKPRDILPKVKELAITTAPVKLQKARYHI